MQKDHDLGHTFSFEILEELPNATKSDLYNKESHYIKEYNSFREGYNQTPGGAMDQFKGKYEYGGGRLPFKKYKRTHVPEAPTVLNEDTSCELEQEQHSTKFKYVIILTILSGIITIYSFHYCIYQAQYPIEGIIIPIIFCPLIITCICVLYLINIKNEDNRKNEEKRIRQILTENSLFVEDRIINLILYLNKDKKKLFSQVYNIPPTNEDIIKFIGENWKHSEMTSLYLTLTFIKKRYPKNNYYASLKTSMPKSLIHNVLIRDNFTCQKCGKNLLDSETEEELISRYYIDFIKPLEENGTFTEDNLITKCKKSCDSHFVPSKELFEIYENTIYNYDENHLTFEKNGLSFNFPDNYSIATIPGNCPDCAVALAKNDGQCDILIELGKVQIDFNNNINLFNSEFKRYVMNLEGFFDIKEIDINRIDQLHKENISCFITVSDVERDSNKEGIIKSIIYFDFNYRKTIRITLNSLLEDKYNCMNDLRVIANSLEYKK